MNACFCRKCGRVFLKGTDVCPKCLSVPDMVWLKAGGAVPVGYHDGEWYRDADNGRRYVAVTLSDGIRLMTTGCAAQWIVATGKREGKLYAPEVYDDLLVCREDWRTPDGVLWTLQYKFSTSICASEHPQLGVCEVVR